MLTKCKFITGTNEHAKVYTKNENIHCHWANAKTHYRYWHKWPQALRTVLYIQLNSEKCFHKYYIYKSHLPLKQRYRVPRLSCLTKLCVIPDHHD